MVALKGDADIGNKINTQVIQPLIEANTRLARSDFPDFNDPNKLGDGQKRVETLTERYTQWRATHTPAMKAFGKDGHPKALIETLSAAKLLILEVDSPPTKAEQTAIATVLSTWTPNWPRSKPAATRPVRSSRR